ncbi:hypothetical protein V8C44DRAFT_55680 [Trichoderma aethiopicum]
MDSVIRLVLWFVGCTHATFCPTAFFAPHSNSPLLAYRFRYCKRSGSRISAAMGQIPVSHGFDPWVTGEGRGQLFVLEVDETSRVHPESISSSGHLFLGHDGLCSLRDSRNIRNFPIEMPSDQHSGEDSAPQKQRAEQLHAER